MSRIREAVKWTARSPLRSILFVLSISLFVFGLYYISPFHTLIGAGNQEYFVIGMISFFSLSTPAYLWLSLLNKWESGLKHAATMFFCVYMFLGLLRLIATGAEPITWIFTLGLGLVAGVCKLFLEVKDGD